VDDRDRRECDLPRIELRDPAPTEIALLRAVQRALLKHPVAGQAVFTALVAEGRRFAGTADGGTWRERLVRSTLLQQARLVFDLATLGMLEERGDGELPSSYLDALFMAAAGGDADAILNRLFWSADDDADGHSGN
jgi:hypothetical protein